MKWCTLLLYVRRRSAVRTRKMAVWRHFTAGHTALLHHYQHWSGGVPVLSPCRCPAVRRRRDREITSRHRFAHATAQPAFLRINGGQTGRADEGNRQTERWGDCSMKTCEETYKLDWFDFWRARFSRTSSHNWRSPENSNYCFTCVCVCVCACVRACEY
jgi:hypothetical protein